jgi:uridine phosphorylase
MKKIAESELVLNPDGSVYHLKLLPEHIADDIIVVGDPGRVSLVSSFFSKIELKIANREFVTHTGIFNKKRVSVIATGIGTDNIDIAINEIDAAVNIDLKKRVTKKKLKSLNIVRIGTSGALQKDIPVDSVVASEFGLGFDGVLNYYRYKKNKQETLIENEFKKQSKWDININNPYIVAGSEKLIKKIGEGYHKGITATAPGFYGPQGRILRLGLQVKDLNQKLASFSFGDKRITNFEMETSALYGLGKLLGHNCCTVCAIIANRSAKKYSKDYKKTVKLLIETTLYRLTS